MKTIFILSCLIALGGCSIFAKQIDKAASSAGKLVKSYCENTTEGDRLITREKVNGAAAPHSVTVTCIGTR